jgi:hypothetical protein
MKAVVRDAFLAVRVDCCSPDVVIADPDLNERYLQECHVRGLAQMPAELNHCLLNLRKNSDLKGIKSKRVVLRNQEEYRFASEIAVRFLERRHRLSLDQILCDPARAAELAVIAAQLAPGFTPFQYRWAALNLRKKKKLRPELLSKVVQADAVITARVVDLKTDKLPARAGLYLFIEPGRVLYVGECKNLQKRISKHLDHSDNKGLAHWFWEHGTTELHLEYHVLPLGITSRSRKALEAELIRSRRPFFNVAGVE